MAFTLTTRPPPLPQKTQPKQTLLLIHNIPSPPDTITVDMENNKRKLSGDRSSNVAVVTPPMRESSSLSQGTASPPSKKQKVSPKAVEHIEIPPVPQSKPSEMAKPRQGRPEYIYIPPIRLPVPAGSPQNAQISVAVPKAAQTNKPDSSPSQLPAAPVPRPPLEGIIHRLDRAASPGHVDDVPIILPVAQSVESNTTNLFPETSSSPEAEPAVRPSQMYDRQVRLPSIPNIQQNTSSISPPNQPQPNQASSGIGLNASSSFTQGSIQATPPQRNTTAPAPLNGSSQSANFNHFPLPVGPVVIYADSLSLEEAELFSRLYYILMHTADGDPNHSEAQTRILSLLQRWHGVSDIAANEDETFSTQRGIHVGNGISYACISLRAKAVLAAIGRFFQDMVRGIDLDLASMPLVELRDSHEHGMINYFHLQKLDRAFLWNAARRMYHHCMNETIIPEHVRRRAAVASGISASALPRSSRATSSSVATNSSGAANSLDATSSSNTPNNSGFSYASATSSATPASNPPASSGGRGTSPNTGTLNSEGAAALLTPGGGLSNSEGVAALLSPGGGPLNF